MSLQCVRGLSMLKHRQEQPKHLLTSLMSLIDLCVKLCTCLCTGSIIHISFLEKWSKRKDTNTAQKELSSPLFRWSRPSRWSLAGGTVLATTAVYPWWIPKESSVYSTISSALKQRCCSHRFAYCNLRYQMATNWETQREGSGNLLDIPTDFLEEPKKCGLIPQDKYHVIFRILALPLITNCMRNSWPLGPQRLGL